MTTREIATRTVRVRVNAAGERVVGEYDLPPDPSYRFSDVLNEPRAFFKIHRLLSATGMQTGESLAIRKDAVCYIEALEEPTTPQRAFEGDFHRVTMTFCNGTEALEGEVFTPASSDVMDILNDPRPFISVRHVCFVDSKVTHAFLAVGKKQVGMLCLA